jgi:hypothetical protein
VSAPVLNKYLAGDMGIDQNDAAMQINRLDKQETTWPALGPEYHDAKRSNTL